MHTNDNRSSHSHHKRNKTRAASFYFLPTATIQLILATKAHLSRKICVGVSWTSSNSTMIPPASLLGPDSLFLAPRLAHMKTISDVGSFCEYARGILNELETKISDEYSRLELELDRSEADLAAASAKVCSLSAELEKKRAELITNQALLAVQESTMRSLEAQISDTRTEIENVRRKIQAEEQRRSNALYDLIPFHGLFAGIISGDMKRAIPLYSQIDGLISALTEDLADAEKREREIQAEINVLQQNLNESKSAVETAKKRVAELEADIVKNNQQVIDIDIRSKDIGQKISAIHDARASLEALKEKYDFLQSDVHEVMDLKDDALIDRCITDFLHLQSASE